MLETKEKRPEPGKVQTASNTLGKLGSTECKAPEPTTQPTNGDFSSVAEAALVYRRDYGLRVIRTGRDKRPVEGDQWARVDYHPDAIPARFTPADGVGIVLGDSSGGFTDVDLDSAEAVALAPWFLPGAGWIFDRGSSDSAHYCYRSPGLKAEKFQAPAPFGVILELRGNPKSGDGLQTVMPPSMHFESGKPRRFKTFKALTTVPADELQQACQRLAAACLFLIGYPEAGRGLRNQYAQALAGFLAVEGRWAEDDVVHFVEAVASAAGDDDVPNRISAARATAAKVAGGDEAVTQAAALADLIRDHGETFLKTARKWLRFKERRAPKNRNEIQKDALIDLMQARKVELWHTADKVAHATVPVGDHFENYPVIGGGDSAFAGWLQSAFFQAYRTPPTRNPLEVAIQWAQGAARFEGKQYETSLRIGHHGGVIYVDLGNTDWEVVRISTDGWSVIPSHDCPVKFLRQDGVKPLPRPEEGGNLYDLFRFFNISSPDHRKLVIGYILGAYMPPEMDFPGLAFEGEAGSAKSTASRFIRWCIDPVVGELTAPPAAEEHLITAAFNNAMVALDNLQFMPSWLHDGLCRLSTGGGLSKRKHYTNHGESRVSVKRPWLINGINRVIRQGDVTSRAVIIHLDPISGYRSKKRLEDEFHEHHPRIMGAIFTALTQCLRQVERLQDDHDGKIKARLADWMVWVTAAEGYLGWDDGDFMQAVVDNQREAHESTMAEDPFVAALLMLLEEAGGNWKGTYEDLSTAFTNKPAIHAVVTHSDAWSGWGLNPRKVGKKWRYIATPLKAIGIEVVISRDTKTNTTVVELKRLES